MAVRATVTRRTVTFYTRYKNESWKQKTDTVFTANKNMTANWRLRKMAAPQKYFLENICQSTFLVTLHRYYWVLLLPFHSYWRHKHSSGYGKLSRISTYTLLTSSWNYSLVFRTDLRELLGSCLYKAFAKIFQGGSNYSRDD